MLLVRTQFSYYGVFGVLKDRKGNPIAVTLEHAYPSPVNYRPKIPAGTYPCVRGFHRLEHMTKDFETFEITSVPGHSGLVFHWGNYNQDSLGCPLLGETVYQNKMITNSRETFDKFMRSLSGVKGFDLVVINPFSLNLQYS